MIVRIIAAIIFLALAACDGYAPPERWAQFNAMRMQQQPVYYQPNIAPPRTTTCYNWGAGGISCQSY